MNRLAGEKSPYLQQHAANPVDWFPWGDEAFALARREHKPIFLSIGYSTCHWCHVMEHESFENGAIARALNEHFVSVKVDREERPDIDRVYMTFVQATTGSGGWPMTVFLTPNLEPFYGGTYFPPESRGGRPGLSELLAEVARAWTEQPERVTDSARQLTDRLRGLAPGSASGPMPGPEALDRGVAELAAVFDARRGGFGSAPKFPRPSEILFLFREWARTGNLRARDMALRTLEAMAEGGMRDHIGGGFHRYSVDANWRVPHFEKMLYDQAQLVLAYLEAAQIDPDSGSAPVAEDTLRYVERDLSDPAGGFYSAEDADSIPLEQTAEAGAHEREGAFYLWHAGEVDQLAGPDALLVRERFGIDTRGNAPFDPQEEFGTGNLLYLASSIRQLAFEHSLDDEQVAARVERARGAMFAARSLRPRPRLDAKILAAWNGLMIAAFARASRVLRSREHLARAEKAAVFIRNQMWVEESRTLFRRFCDGEAAIEAYADDFAGLIFGLLQIVQAGGDLAWLTWAIELQRRQDELFWDESGAGWFSTTGKDRSVLFRLKEGYDGAEPSAGSLSASNLLTLAHLTADEDWQSRIELVLGAFSDSLSDASRSVPWMMANLSAYHHGLDQVVIVGPREDPVRREMERVIGDGYRPFAVTLSIHPEELHGDFRTLMPWLETMTARGGRTTGYVCRRFECHEPTTDVAEFAEQVRSMR